MQYVLCTALMLMAAAVLQAQTAARSDWVKKSDENARLLLAVDEKFAPESAAANGVTGLDDRIYEPSENLPGRRQEALRKVRDELKSRLAREQDSRVKQDLEILIGAAEHSIRSSEANEKHLVPDTDVASTVFYGVQSLLDDQIAPERRPAALVRLKRYAGLEAGYTPITVRQENWIRARMRMPGLLAPATVSVAKSLENTATYLNGAGLLFEKYKIAGYEEPLAKLREEFSAYDEFVRKEVLPRARASFRLPPEIYRIQLDEYGVDYAPDELIRLAHKSFSEIQGQMQELAPKVAKERGWSFTDYRDVIGALKKEQIPGDQILSHYQKRLAEIEETVRRNHLVTLPERPALIRIATAAETAQQPAPHMLPPPLLNNHGERGVFVLPLETTGQGGAALKYDDFTFAAASWTMTAHEARPGHELQFDRMVENGVSLARALFAFNSTNVEGWGLYSEWFMQPYMPDDGKLISLQFRLLRAARAFLDPELQEGRITPDQAMAVLENDVAGSKAFATEEVERFTFRMPGQAVSYFDGFTRLLEIRQAAEAALGSKFDVRKFHDFVLSQGLLPPKMMRKAVMEELAGQAKRPE